VAATSIIKHPQRITAGVESLHLCLPDD